MVAAPTFAGSQAYWENRYLRGENSGKGSYGRLADFKARFLNEHMRRFASASVIEFGCGDGNQLSLARYPTYAGYDVSEQAIEICRERFADDPSKQFFLMSSYDGRQADVALSLDVIFHLVEDDVFETYMVTLFSASPECVIVYSTNFDRAPAVGLPHVRHREFVEWVENRRPDWRLVDVISNDYGTKARTPGPTSPADFYVFEKSD